MKKILKLSDLNMSLGSVIGLLVFLVPALFAQWEPDMKLCNYPSRTGWNSSRCIATDSFGRVHVVWHDWRYGAAAEVFYRRSTDWGATWETESPLTVNDGIASGAAGLAFSESYVYVVWQDYRDGVDAEIYTKISTDGGATWGEDIRLSNAVKNSFSPSVSASGSDVHVAWCDFRTQHWEIFYRHSSDHGISWGPETRLTYDDYASSNPSIFAYGSNVNISWEDDRDMGNRFEIYYKRSTDSGVTWGPDTRICFSLTAVSIYSCCCAAGSNVYVVWGDTRDGGSNENEIYFNRSTDYGESWGGDTRLTNDAGNSTHPSVYASGSNVHVAWQENRDGNDEIYYKLSTDGGVTWGTDTCLTNNSASSRVPSVMAADSTVHVVWSDNREGNFKIYYKRNPTGNSGVEENSEVRGQKLEVKLKATPNPFTSFATVVGHEGQRFTLYDISGKMVGTYKGNRIGEGISAGVYFLVPKAKNAKPVRIVKVR